MVIDKSVFKSESGISNLLIKQLAEGTYRNRGDSAPSDWVARAWKDLPQKEAGWVTTAVHDALLHEDPTVRSEALRTLDVAPKMADGGFLLDVVHNHFDLFRGLQRVGDSVDADCGRDLVMLTAGVLSGQKGRDFRRHMATDPDYGLQVLATLTRDDGDWVVEHSPQLVNDTLDPNEVRLGVILFNLRKDEMRLIQLVRRLVMGGGIVDNGRLAATIQNKIPNQALQNKLLAELSV